MTRFPRIFPFGDQAALVQFGEEIHPDLSQTVRAFVARAKASRIPGVGTLVPSYASVLFHFHPSLLSFEEASAWARGILSETPEGVGGTGPVKEVAVVYGGAYGPDLPRVAAHNGISEEDVIRLHSSPAYLVYVIGGFPGLAAMGTVPSRIETPRLSTPRTKVAPGSVAIAGRQTGIYAVPSPGGWQIIGRTPLRLFDPDRDPPSLFQPGDRVRFSPISEERFLAWPR